MIRDNRKKDVRMERRIPNGTYRDDAGLDRVRQCSWPACKSMQVCSSGRSSRRQEEQGQTSNGNIRIRP